MKTRVNLAVALVLIGIGAWFLALQISPLLKTFAYGDETWPIQIVLAGVFLGLAGLLTWVPALMTPACIFAGLGGMLFWQNLTGRWETWAYAWALIPGFAGAGVLLTGLLNRERRAVVGGSWTILNSLALFAIFGSFLGDLSTVSQYWPVLIIALGGLMLVQNVKSKSIN